MNKSFKAILQKSTRPGGWTYVIWPDSVTVFKTRGLVKVKVAIDGYIFENSLMARGDGTHMLPVKKTIRTVIGKEAGAEVTIQLKERL